MWDILLMQWGHYMTPKTVKSVSAKLEALLAARRKYAHTVSRYDNICYYTAKLKVFCNMHLKYESILMCFVILV
jgi:hypothetical protein